jgi:hypothetical protein
MSESAEFGYELGSDKPSAADNYNLHEFFILPLTDCFSVLAKNGEAA